jgi:hypothetical protein
MPDPIADLLKSAKTIAVVGCSTNPDKDAHTVPKYMLDKGYHVLPVNPTAAEIFGRPVFKALSEIREPVDIVNVFRPGPECDKVAEEAIKLRPRAVWLQLGITNERAKRIVESAGIQYIEDRCLRVEHKRVFGWDK